MAHDPGNVRERLWKAVGCLAESAAPIQKRLEYAGVELAPLRADDFRPHETRGAFREIMAALTADGEGLTSVTARMNDEEAERIARKITKLDAAYRPLS